MQFRADINFTDSTWFWEIIYLPNNTGKLKSHVLKKEKELLPGEIFNLAFFVINTGNDIQKLNAGIVSPEGWKAIIKNQNVSLNPSEKKLLVYSLQIPLEYPVGEQPIKLIVTNTETGDTTGIESVPVEG